MSEINLRTYNEKIEGLIAAESHEEAILHCQHILRHYPKHLETYRLLARACLGKGDLSQAADLYRRVLSADPEDFLARVGLGVVYTEDDAIEEAIWHIGHAFELAPGNVEIRDELLSLYDERDGAGRERLKLTQGALGRLYARGGLFPRAVAELRAVLERDPKLIDVQMALAEALWRDGQRLEAEQLCLDAVEKLPNCLKANLLLGEIWLHSDREEQGEARLAITRALDPENTQAQKLFGGSSPVPPETVEIPYLETAFRPSRSVLADESREEDEEAFGWLRQLRAERLEGMVDLAAPPAARSEEVEFEEPEGEADWLQALEAVDADDAPEAEAEGPSDWLRELGLEVAAPEPEESAEAVAEDQEIPDWLRDSLSGLAEAPPEPELVAEGEEAREVPDWLRAAGAGIPGEPARAEEVEMGPPMEDAGEIPEWLRELQSQAGDEPEETGEAPEGTVEEEEPAPPPVEPAEEIPEWLHRLQPEAAEEAPAPTTEEPAEMPISTEGMTPEQERAAGLALWQQILREEGLEELITEEAPAAEAPPVEEEAPVFEAPPPVEPAEEIPAWLEAVQPEAAPVEEAPVAEVALPVEPAEEIPEWLQRLRPEEAPPVEEAPAAEAPLPLEPAEEILERLEAVQFEEAPVAEVAPPVEPAEEIPEWLQRLRPEEAPPVEEAPVAEAPLPVEPAEEILERLEAVQFEEAPVAEVAPPVEPAEEELGEVPVSTEGMTPEQEREAGLALWQQILREEGLEDLIAGEEPVAETPAPVEEVPVAEVQPPSEPAEEIPEWLQRVEEPQAPKAVIEEVGEVPLAQPAEEIPEWLRQLRGEIPDELAAEPEAEEFSPTLIEFEEMPEPVVAEEEVEGPPPWLAELEEAVSEGAPVVLEPSVETELVADFPVEEAEDEGEQALPGWLRGVFEEEEPTLDIRDLGVAAEAVEEVTEAEVLPPTVEITEVAAPLAAQVEPEEAAAPPVVEIVEEVPAPEETEVVSPIARYEADLAVRPGAHRSRLALARAYVEESDLDAALEHYEKLIRRSATLDEVSHDLEAMAEKHPGSYVVQQLLGDAYMKDGQLPKALEAYRQAKYILSLLSGE